MKARWFTPRFTVPEGWLSAVSYYCRTCKARKNRPCKTKNGYVYAESGYYHRARLDRLQEARRESLFTKLKKRKVRRR